MTNAPASEGSAPLVVVEDHGDVRLIRLNRPAARNALNAPLAQAGIDAVEAGQDAAVIVITGADPAFCAGLDLRALGVDTLSQLPHFSQAVQDSKVPVIAAVNGPAVTGGFEVALACDFIVASDRARFADTHLRVGVYPGPVLVDLPRRVGTARAREMSLTGNFVDAETALRIGLANHVVPHDELIPFALELATAIAEQDRGMVAAMREDWDATDRLPVAEAHGSHNRFGAERGYRDGTAEALASHRSDVIARAHRQLS
ncbi:MAG: enoyl-CoA hydratase [Ilumatobacteraceae bacterium]